MLSQQWVHYHRLHKNCSGGLAREMKPGLEASTKHGFCTEPCLTRMGEPEPSRISGRRKCPAILVSI